jgi:CRP/FNR family transcriptional regulator
MESKQASNIINLRGLKQACSHCSLQDLCLPFGITNDDLEQLEEIIRQRRPIQRNDHLYRPGDRLANIYAVRSGSIKTYTLTNDGQEQITGFHLPGELLGLDAIGDGAHPCAAKALETTSVCEMPFDQLEELAGRIPGLQHQLFRLMSKELQADEQFMMLLGKKSSEERLAAFLLSLSQRFHQRGYSSTEFNLSMSRNDIANYLGLAVETVSRLFSRFQASGIIEVQRKLIAIVDLPGLQTVAGVSSDQSAGSRSG